MKLTLTNDFHNTEAALNIPADGYISDRVAKRVHRDLCGNSDCTCGGYLGERMSKWLDGKEIIIEPDYRYESNGKGVRVTIGHGK